VTLQRRRAIAIAISVLVLAFALPGSAAFPILGPPVFVYNTLINGKTSPANVNDAAALNTILYGANTPPAADLVSSSSVYNGTLTDLTAAGNLASGMANVACTNFTFTNGTGCVEVSTSTVTSPLEPLAVQSWPFYVGSGTSSNVNPGGFTLEANTDDGSWFSIAPAAFAYAQPANFGPVTGLTARTSVVSSITVKGAGSVTGTFAVASASACSAAQHIFYLTYEYLEAVGGQAQIEYSWQPPAAAALGTPTEAVLWGQVFSNGVALSAGGIALPATAGQPAATLATDAQGCFGYDYQPTWTNANTVGSVSATNTAANGGLSLTQTAVAVTMGAATQLTFNFLPVLSLSKSHATTFVDGSTATYALVVNNKSGTAPTVNPITIVDTLPAALTYDAALTTGTNWACAAAGQTVTCTYSGSALAPGNVAGATAPTLTLGVNVKGPQGTATNSAIASVNSKDTTGTTIAITSNTATDPTTLIDPGSVVKTVQNITSGEASPGTADTGKPGDVLQYTLTFTNAGSAALSNVDLTDVVPVPTTYVAASATCASVPAGVTCAPTFAAGTVTWTMTGSFPGGGTATVRFRATIN
jgi:uncharacterized repeat protein (TIGR01451 family)